MNFLVEKGKVIQAERAGYSLMPGMWMKARKVEVLDFCLVHDHLFSCAPDK